MGKAPVKTMTIDWSEENGSCIATVKEYASMKQIVNELNNAPVDLETMNTRIYAAKGYSTTKPGSKAYVTQKIVMKFEGGIGEKKAAEVIEKSVWEFSSQTKTELTFLPELKTAAKEKQSL